MKEKWRPVPGYPGYEVSDQGGVRSVDREVQSRWGTPKVLKGKVLTQVKVGGNGPSGRYPACVLYLDGKRRQVGVHVLVLECFVGPRPDGANGLHRDDDPDNNHLSNLYWGTQTQNIEDAIRSGRHTSVTEAAKTHCPHGHEYSEENTYIKPRTGHRDCRACHRKQARNAYHRRSGTVSK